MSNENDLSKIKEIKVFNGVANFPISWLNKQGYCEYSLYLEYHKGISLAPTDAMITGTKIHKKLEDDFQEGAVETSFSEMIELSKTEDLLTRELWVSSAKYGIRGFIDEIWMTPKEFIIIDDKPGHIAYNSTINQVLAYCLAFKETINDDKRKIRAALRTRGTDNIFWNKNFDKKAEKDIKKILNRMQLLINGEIPYIPTNNPKKCAKCRFNMYCEYKK
jgi:CRISPR-associated protein Cas4